MIENEDVYGGNQWALKYPNISMCIGQGYFWLQAMKNFGILAKHNLVAATTTIRLAGTIDMKGEGENCEESQSEQLFFSIFGHFF